MDFSKEEVHLRSLNPEIPGLVEVDPRSQDLMVLGREVGLKMLEVALGSLLLVGERLGILLLLEEERLGILLILLLGVHLGILVDL